MTRKPRVILEIPPAPNLTHEQKLWENGVRWIAGLDEAGRGAWAGPVVAAVAILPNVPDLEKILFGVRDSKQMNVRQREIWVEKIKVTALSWGIGSSDNKEIDSLGILPATRLAMMRALTQLSIQPEHLLIDAVQLSSIEISQSALIKGDQRSLSIAAASILAKTTRDSLMCQEHTINPLYGFHRHKGYGTRYHQESLAQNGPCPIHRMSFRPLREQFSFKL